MVWASVSVDCVAHTLMTYTHVSFGTYHNPQIRWSAPSDTDPACIPSVPDECGVSTLLADWVMCYELWPNANNPAPLVVDYRACDARLEAAGAESAFGVYMTPLIAPSVPRLAEWEVARLIRYRAEGNPTRPTGWGSVIVTDAEWDALVAVIDTELHSRYCGRRHDHRAAGRLVDRLDSSRRVQPRRASSLDLDSEHSTRLPLSMWL